MKRKEIGKDDFKRFLLASVLVGIISAIYNIFVFTRYGFNSSVSLIYFNFIDKIVIFVFLGLFLSLAGEYKMIRFENLKLVFVFSLSVAIINTFLEFLNGSLVQASFILSLIIRTFIVMTGIIIAGMIVKR